MLSTTVDMTSYYVLQVVTVEFYVADQLDSTENSCLASNLSAKWPVRYRVLDLLHRSARSRAR